MQSTGAISSTNDRAGGWTRSELQLAKTLFIIFVVFLCCWSPYAVVVLIDYDDRWPKVGCIYRNGYLGFFTRDGGCNIWLFGSLYEIKNGGGGSRGDRPGAVKK